MGVVLSLVKHTARDTISVLRALLELALAGNLRGVAICYRDSEGNEGVALTGIYRAHPEYAVNAGARLKHDGVMSSEDLERTLH
jgi:hypothetical protein